MCVQNSHNPLSSQKKYMHKTIYHVFKTHNLLFTKKYMHKTSSFKPFVLFSKRENFLNLQFFSTKYINIFPTHLLSKLLIMNNIPSHLNQKHIQGRMCEFASIGHLSTKKKREMHLCFYQSFKCFFPILPTLSITCAFH
jgi:hypothetical protein